jgi:hypothetical protein
MQDDTVTRDQEEEEAAGQAQEQAADQRAAAAPAAEAEGSDDESSEELEGDDAHVKARWARMRGLAGPDTSSDEESEEEGDENESDLERMGMAAAAGDDDIEVRHIIAGCSMHPSMSPAALVHLWRCASSCAVGSAALKVVYGRGCRDLSQTLPLPL